MDIFEKHEDATWKLWRFSRNIQDHRSKHREFYFLQTGENLYPQYYTMPDTEHPCTLKYLTDQKHCKTREK